MPKTEELLAVLDLPEEEQWCYICALPIWEEIKKLPVSWKWNDVGLKRLVLADLAFRLRDEVSRNRFSYGINEAQKYLGITEENLEVTSWECAYWGMIIAKPIHWIIAALIAKELNMKDCPDCNVNGGDGQRCLEHEAEWHLYRIKCHELRIKQIHAEMSFDKEKEDD